MLHKLIFKAGYFLKRPCVISYYNNFQQTQWQSYEWLRNQQEKQLRELISFAYENVPYYTKLFNQLGIVPSNITTIKGLEKLPILTKQTIKENQQDFIPKNINKLKYLNGSTGGSTGEPLKYRMSTEDYERGVGLLYCGWGYGGYEMGDKVAVIAGSSLIPTTKSETKKKIQEFFLNSRHYSSFEMSKENLFKYFYDINRWKPDFIRGYASSIYLFAKFIQDNNLKLDFQPKAIFTTAEKLFDKQRTLIEEVLGVKVFDNYGLNDGGISACECEQHCGMHINTERAILEVVDDEGRQIINQEGKILATSLYNYALPFIRYDTGDLGIISDSACTCGRHTPLLKGISGRVTDFLKLNNIIIGSPVLTVLMGKFDIEQYQIIQGDSNSITCKIIKGKVYKKEDEAFIRDSFYKHVGKINIKFDYVDSISTTEAGKYKFIINNLGEV
ncbi:MAG: phenylacetate--CoA ligase family protein [candidate division WOR-3 bacterium]|nr:phenylacetate--CoA ligase family protein [candidate division WOR-3 bacterium]